MLQRPRSRLDTRPGSLNVGAGPCSRRLGITGPDQERNRLPTGRAQVYSRGRPSTGSMHILFSMARPVRAAKLRGLVNRELRAAHGAVEASIKARKELLDGLEKLVESNRAKVVEEEATTTELQRKIDEVETIINEVEDSIMRGQDTPASNGHENGESWSGLDPDRPEAEGFTPPPPDVEGFTPPPQDEASADTLEGLSGDQGYASTTGAEPMSEQPPNFDEPAPSYVPPPATENTGSGAEHQDFLKNLLSQQGQVRQASGDMSADPRLKRRKLSHNNGGDVDEEIFGGAGVDEAGISAMLGQ